MWFQSWGATFSKSTPVGGHNASKFGANIFQSLFCQYYIYVSFWPHIWRHGAMLAWRYNHLRTWFKESVYIQFQIIFGSFLRQGLEESGEVVHALVQPQQVEEPILSHQYLLLTTYNFLQRQKCKSRM